jgi:hypothetical protein
MNRSARNQHLLAQISTTNPFRETLAPRAFAILRDFENAIEAISRDPNLSAGGKRGKAKEQVHKALSSLQDDVQKPIDQHRAETERMSAGIKVPSFDKADIVGAMNRKELRDASRAMSFGQRAALMGGPTRDANFIDAVCEQAPWVSGFDIHNPNDAELVEMAMESRKRDLNATLMGAIEARVGTESEITMVVNVLFNDIQSDAADLTATRAA